jgi:hypothetical protein
MRFSALLGIGSSEYNTGRNPSTTIGRGIPKNFFIVIGALFFETFEETADIGVSP